jgi:hypothetical protein
MSTCHDCGGNPCRCCEHEKYLFLLGAAHGLKLRLRAMLGDPSEATSRVMFDAHEVGDLLDTINAVLDAIGEPNLRSDVATLLDKNAKELESP